MRYMIMVLVVMECGAPDDLAPVPSAQVAPGSAQAVAPAPCDDPTSAAFGACLGAASACGVHFSDVPAQRAIDQAGFCAERAGQCTNVCERIELPDCDPDEVAPRWWGYQLPGERRSALFYNASRSRWQATILCQTAGAEGFAGPMPIGPREALIYHAIMGDPATEDAGASCRVWFDCLSGCAP
jgi:hypothetical protein